MNVRYNWNLKFRTDIIFFSIDFISSHRSALSQTWFCIVHCIANKYMYLKKSSLKKLKSVFLLVYCNHIENAVTNMILKKLLSSSMVPELWDHAQVVIDIPNNVKIIYYVIVVLYCKTDWYLTHSIECIECDATQRKANQSKRVVRRIVLTSKSKWAIALNSNFNIGNVLRNMYMSFCQLCTFQ